MRNPYPHNIRMSSLLSKGVNYEVNVTANDIKVKGIININVVD